MTRKSLLNRLLDWAGRQQAAAAAAVIEKHAGETVYRTVLFELEGSTQASRGRVVAVLAEREGLSFRDAVDREVAQVAASRILSVELAPHDPANRIRPARVALIDGSPVSFWVGNDQDTQAETIVAIRTALGR